jgi:uncharacterized protein
MSELGRLQQELAGLLLYRELLDDRVMRAIVSLIEAMSHRRDLSACMRGYGDLFYTLASSGRSWEDYIIDLVLRADNPFSRQAQIEPEGLSPLLIAATKHDLAVLEHLYQFVAALPHSFQQICGSREELPQWLPTTQEIAADRQPTFARLAQGDWQSAITHIAEYYYRHGVGIWARYKAFRWHDRLIGIEHFDPIELDSLVGYEEQIATISHNTECLLAGYPALNILLYGGKGTGKSSIVKGLIDRYYKRGLRLIEVGKSNLHELSLILDPIVNIPQKFIIFVDDLSFEEDDENFKSLKVVLEGSATAKPRNVVVYATSNRRHLVREYFAERPRPSDADEIHQWDTVQEKLSFSDRFGITLTFEPADQNKYLKMVRHLAEIAKLEIDAEDLKFRALQWATRHNGRSGRTAKQLIDFLQGEIAIGNIRN